MAPRRPSVAAETARNTFEEGALAESLPTVEVPAAEFDAGLGVLAAFVRAGLVASTGEARRQIRGGGLKVNDETLSDEKAAARPRLARRRGRGQAVARPQETRAAARGVTPARAAVQRKLSVAAGGWKSGSGAGEVPSITPNILRRKPGVIAEKGLTESTGAEGEPTSR